MYNEISVMKIEGINTFSWKDKKTGENKSGANLHCSYKESSIQGTGVARLFLSGEKYHSIGLSVGDKINALDRGRDGFVFVSKL